VAKRQLRKPKRRNPIATVIRRLRPKTVPSGKVYRRKSKHRDQTSDDENQIKDD